MAAVLQEAGDADSFPLARGFDFVLSLSVTYNPSHGH